MMVPSFVRVRPTLRGFGLSAIVACDTFTVALPGAMLEPCACARIVVLPAATGVTFTEACVEPDAIVTLPCTVTMLGSVDSVTTWSLCAADGRLTVILPGAAVVRLRGFGVRTRPVDIDVVCGLLFAYPLFTINCTT